MLREREGYPCQNLSTHILKLSNLLMCARMIFFGSLSMCLRDDLSQSLVTSMLTFTRRRIECMSSRSLLDLYLLLQEHWSVLWPTMARNPSEMRKQCRVWIKNAWASRLEEPCYIVCQLGEWKKQGPSCCKIRAFLWVIYVVLVN